VLFSPGSDEALLVPDSCRANGTKREQHKCGRDRLLSRKRLERIVSALLSKCWQLFWTFRRCRISTIYIHCW